MAANLQHFLVPVDLSDADSALLDLVYDLAQQVGSRVTLLHVIESMGDESDDDMREFYTGLEQQARSHLERIAARFLEGGLNIERHVVFGKRVGRIVEYSMKSEIDLLFIRSKKVDLGQPQAEVGTLSQQLSLLCQCPVYVLK